ncbi:MAG TPA: hypothetical protein VF062_10025 [Candidatus Limnocylindrales bacterium]
MRTFSIAIVLAFALTGCAAQAQSGTQTQPSPVNSAYERGLKYAQCMRENGINMPDPEPGKPGIVRFDTSMGSPEKIRAAQEACREFAPSSGQGGQVDPARAEQLRKFAQCMRDNGVEKFPDPEGGMMRMNQDVANDPDFNAAREKCSKEFLPEAGAR